MSRRAVRVPAAEAMAQGQGPLAAAELAAFETFDMLYRSLCALLYNYVPTSGHPGGSISSGRFVAGIVFDGLDYDLAAPDRQDADVLSYAAGHKAMGLYAMWALRDEIARLAAPELLPGDDCDRLRLEDLLGFRRNPSTAMPLFAALHSRALDGHPTPATPFVRLATGASGVGLASSIGLAIAARDRFGENCPRIHISEGEGGLTPGRVSEALAAAGTASLANVVVHLDFNQASIDSDHVCRDGDVPGDYVQWEPGELFYLHDWNVVQVSDGHDFQQIVAAQRHARELDNGQPTAVIYRTHKGWKYGVEGRASHGAGHKLCSAGFHQSLTELIDESQATLPTCDLANPPCAGSGGDQVREECFWEALQIVRRRLEQDQPVLQVLAARLTAARERLDRHGRSVRPAAPRVAAVYELAARAATDIPEQLRLEPGASDDTPRGPRSLVGAIQQGVGRILAHGVRRPARLDQRGGDRGGLRPRLLERRNEPRGATALDRWHLRGRHRRSAFGHLGLRPCHRRGIFLRGLHGATRSYRRPAARHRGRGAARFSRRALRIADPDLRSCRACDR